MRSRGRVDANQEEIVKILRLYPQISVAVTSAIGNGFPDIVCGIKGRNYFFEIKDPNQPPSKRVLTEDEQKFQDNWQGQVQTVETVVEILDAINFKRRE